jgi:pyruvate dehydrogenase (quinone)
MASEPSQTRHLIDPAFWIAIAKRTVTRIIFSNDVQELNYKEPKPMHGTLHANIGYQPPWIIPYEADLERVAAVLNAVRSWLCL